MQAESKNRKGSTAEPQIRISEIYASVQGEGQLTGTPSVFVRTSGCNLRCWFCDTRFASWEPEGDYLSIGQIVEQCLGHDQQHVVLTGGEPMIYHRIGELCSRLRSAGRHVTIETAGTIYLPLECDLMSLSPKLSTSAPEASAGAWRMRHHQRRQRLDVVRQLMRDHEYQLKFVVDQPSDAEEVLQYLELLGGYDGQRVLLMPQGTQQSQLDQQAEWLLPWCEQHDLRFCPRAHIQWFGGRRGT